MTNPELDKSDYKKRLDEILPLVQRPVRYIGGEWNSVRKEGPVTIVLAYPDVYEIGMSNLGLQILYDRVNNESKYAAERVFSPWPDMETEMRRTGLPLLTLENHLPVADADIFGITLQYEMTFTNVLNLIDLAGLPLLSSERNAALPLIIAGGPCAFNAEPMAAYFDAVVIGEGEELIIEIMDAFHRWKIEGTGAKESLLKSLAGLSGVYVPSLYTDDNGYPLKPVSGISQAVSKRAVDGFSSLEPPLKPVVPFTEAIHDRCAIEVMRGCGRGCRFCQAGIVYRPVREREPAMVADSATAILANTGYDEISLVSLSSTDYGPILPLLRELSTRFSCDRVSLSLPSLRTDRFSIEVASEVSRTKKTGLTFAPEAGTERLRAVINKGVKESDLIDTAGAAFTAGWRRIKLYFMIGLPTETDEDIRGIIDLAQKVLDEAKRILSKGDFNRVKVVVSVSSFVPKTHTPFQWLPMISRGEIIAKQQFLKDNLRNRQIDLKWHDPGVSVVEGAMARGGRELAQVIKTAWETGCRFDGWHEYFNFDKWSKAFSIHGFDLEEYAARGFDATSGLAWDHLNTGVDKEWLLDEARLATAGEATPDCRTDACSDCGVCPNLSIDIDLAAREVVFSEKDAG